MRTLRRNTAIAAMAMAAMLSLTSCATTPSFATTPVFRVNGTCTSKKGTLHGIGSGFTASATYQTIVRKPDGSAYDLSKDSQFGNTSQTGTIDTWAWPCAGDPSGTYQLTIKDLQTGNTAKTKFTIG